MINLLLGAPGGGKSYEAVVYHVIPAIEQGRKVITNLPLNVDELEKVFPGCSSLIEIRTETKAVRNSESWRITPFWHVDDFKDDWRHPVKGFGPLFVIDECHIPLPVRGTMLAVEEWFSLHRHHLSDVLLITQSYGKINGAIRDLVQVVYRVRKNVALGSMGTYTRKVQDGLRGAVVNTSQRKYEKQYYKFYKSHTQSTGGAELSANDIKPVWMHWSFIGTGIFFVIFVCIMIFGDVGLPFSAKKKPEPKLLESQRARLAASRSSSSLAPSSSSSTPVHTGPMQSPAPPFPAPSGVVDKPEPLAGKLVHLVGSISLGGRSQHIFKISMNGQTIATTDSDQLEAAGYRFESAGDCVGWLRYKSDPSSKPFAVVCDAPTVAIAHSL